MQFHELSERKKNIVEETTSNFFFSVRENNLNAVTTLDTFKLK